VRRAARTAPAASGSTGSVQPESLLDAGPIAFYDVEARLLADAIHRAGGNLSEAARLLGLSYKTMRYRAHKYGLAGEEPPAN
jgi:DNA-binding NtrC family response regulator